ncbi:MAG: hypothetical protein IJX64_00790 [Clostridia bacterium]|nr:hypothetical protein [Clostridia bacterium]
MDLAYLWEGLKEYYTETYFSPDLSAITSFDTTDVQRFLPLMIFGICFGIFIAVCISYYHGQYLGEVVRRLYKLDAFAPECAKPLAEIGCDKFFIRRALRRDTVLAKYVKTADDVKAKDARFYIVEEQKYIADKRFKSVRGGMLSLVLAFIICTAVCLILLYFVPDVLQLADNLYNMLKPQ